MTDIYEDSKHCRKAAHPLTPPLPPLFGSVEIILTTGTNLEHSLPFQKMALY